MSLWMITTLISVMHSIYVGDTRWLLAASSFLLALFVDAQKTVIPAALLLTSRGHPIVGSIIYLICVALSNDDIETILVSMVIPLLLCYFF